MAKHRSPATVPVAGTPAEWTGPKKVEDPVVENGVFRFAGTAGDFRAGRRLPR
jgi:hypothetical protein